MISVWRSLAFLFLLAGVGCPDPAADDDTVAPDDDDTVAAEIELEVTVGEAITTVVRVSWTPVTDGYESIYVEYGPEEPTVRAPAEVGGDGRASALLVGLKAATTYRLRAVEEVDGAVAASAEAEVLTGDLPAGYPTATVEVFQPDLAHGHFLLTGTAPSPTAAVILDADGDVVWWYEVQSFADTLPVDRVVLDREAGAVVFRSTIENAELGLHGSYLVTVSLDGTSADWRQLPDCHHDMVRFDDGTLLLIEEDTRVVADELVIGDRLVILDEDDVETELWSTWDDFHYDPDAQNPPGSPDGDWTHANAVQAHGDAYYVSVRNQSTIIEVDPDGGGLVRQIAGDDSDYVAPNGDTELYLYQHQFQLVDGGILVFDNRAPAQNASRAVEYALDDDTGLAERVWYYEPFSPIYSLALGDVARLDNGNTLVTFSVAGQIDEVDPAGDPVWRLNLEMGHFLSYATWEESLYE